MKLLVQPDDGVGPLIKGINAAKTSIEILIFRFDRKEIERALAEAVVRGVEVRALVAHANRSGEDGLRRLEQRLLGAGVAVSRTADDLVRYHGKMMIVDRRQLWVLGFNLTFLDIERSRSFAVVTTNRHSVHEALRLFEADAKRARYEGSHGGNHGGGLVVSPVNARQQLSLFIKGAKKELLIYDPAVSDPAMTLLLDQRSKAGIEIRIIGRLAHKYPTLLAREPAQLRLHTRTMVRDGTHVFIGSQSLKVSELDARREIGLIFRDRKVAAHVTKIFEKDWKLAVEGGPAEPEDSLSLPPAMKVAKKIAKAVVKELPPVTPVLEQMIKEVTGEAEEAAVLAPEVEENVRSAVKSAIKGVLEEVVEEVVEPQPETNGSARNNGHQG